MKQLQKCLFFIMIISSSTAISQTYEIRRTDNQRRGINYGNTVPTTDLAGYIGGVQSQMQARYNYNYQKVSDKLDDIGYVMRRLTKQGYELTDERRTFLNNYQISLSKINRINFSDNASVTNVMSYLRSVEEELNSW